MGEELRFRSHGAVCAATLHRPTASNGGPTGCVVMANGFSLTRRDGLPLFAERFARAGLCALTFDFSHLGDSTGEPPQLVDHRRHRRDFAAAIAFARTLEGVDPAGVAVWGFSLGGGLAVAAAADDAQVAAVLALCPMLDGLAFALGGDLRLGVRLVAASVKDRVGRRPVTVPAVGPPGSFAVITQPEALPGVRAMCTSPSSWRNEVRARPLASSIRFRPVRIATRVRCPLMVCAGDDDALVPRRPIIRLARLAPRGELHRYPVDHFGAFTSRDGFERVAADQEAFLRRHLASDR